MLEESYLESTLRWHLYRRWKRPQKRERICERLFHQVMRSAQSGIFIDCGANIGDVTAAVRRYKKKVICFEPDLDALSVLRERFASDNQVEIIDKAVGNSDRTAQFYQSPKVAAGDISFTQASSVIRTEANNGLTRTVEVVDITRFIHELDRPVSVLKMDIEGLEAECLEKMIQLQMLEKIGYLLVETHERFSEDLSMRISLIRKYVSENNIKNIYLDWI